MTAPAKPKPCGHPRSRLVFNRSRADREAWCLECCTSWCPSCGAIGEWNAAGMILKWTLPTREHERRAAARKEQVK